MELVDHTTRKHALLSASGAARWLNCTPSPRLEEAAKIEDKSSVFAAEGTLAHEFGELSLQLLSKQSIHTILNPQLEKCRAHELYADEMEEQVEKYTDFVMEQFHEANKINGDAVLLIEEKVDLTHYIEEGFGTNDAIVIADGVLDVDDLKYGKGIRVDAEDNPQLKLYGLGALRAYEMLYDIHTVRLNIIQPRLDHISTWEISAEDLFKWGEETVKPRAKQAYAGEGKTCAGTWCKWCKVKAKCRSLAEQNLAIAKHDFADPQLLSDEELLEVYKRISSLTDWADSVGDFVKAEALNGKKWEGYKLVEGRANRKWADAKMAMTTLSVQGFRYPQFSEAKLFGIGKIEKLLGKVKFNSLMKPHVIKPQGPPTLVIETDKRPAIGIDQAKEDFK